MTGSVTNAILLKIPLAKEGEMSHHHGHVVEIATAKVKDGVTKDQLLATVDAVSSWVKEQPGFISRDLTYSADADIWIDVIWWESLDAANAAAEIAMTSPACQPMFELLDMQSVQMLHGERVIPTVTRNADAA